MRLSVARETEEGGRVRPDAMHWHIITPEFPPKVGGVADYSQQLADALRAAGDAVEIWTTSQNGAPLSAPVHTAMGRLTAFDCRRLDKRLNAFPGPRRLLLQWCPHGFGWRSMNVPFCLWILSRALRGDRVELMIHEPFLSFGEGSWAQDVAALVHRSMMILLLLAARRVWISIPAWRERIAPYLLGRAIPIGWLPVPSNIPVQPDTGLTAAIRQRVAPAGEGVVGHFGTYGRHVGALLAQTVPALLEGQPGRRLLLMGLNSDSFRQRLVSRYPALAAQMMATGGLDRQALSSHLAACDVLLQPYPDGVSSRRGTIMAALAHGIPTVTTVGHLSEGIWAQSGAVALAPVAAPAALAAAVDRLLRSPAARTELREQAQVLYRTRFDLARSVERMRRGDAIPAV